MNKKVLFNIPNLICYLRIVLLIVFIRSSNILYYILSASLDFLDGYTARKFNQCTFIGSVLDMCIDRASNLVILLISPTTLSYNPKFCYLSCDFLIYLVLLDFISHFICFVVNVKRNTHHKVVSGILSIYYNKKVLFTLCGGAELFFLFMFKGNGLKDYFVVFYYVKSFFHFVQLINAMKEGSEIK